MTSESTRWSGDAVAGNGLELVLMTFGFPPKNPRGSPVFNFKSEGRRFDKATAA